MKSKQISIDTLEDIKEVKKYLFWKYKPFKIFILLKLNCLLIVGNYFDGKYIYNFRNWYKS